jgi:hypothetical protein
MSPVSDIVPVCMHTRGAAGGESRLCTDLERRLLVALAGHLLLGLAQLQQLLDIHQPRQLADHRDVLRHSACREGRGGHGD